MTLFRERLEALRKNFKQKIGQGGQSTSINDLSATKTQMKHKAIRTSKSAQKAPKGDLIKKLSSQ